MATTTDIIEQNRVTLREWFVANPRANIHTALNLATKENRAQGLTRDIASRLRREADAELELLAENERTRVAAEAAALAAVRCARCNQLGHYASQCTVELPQESAPVPEPVATPPRPFVLDSTDAPDAPETLLRALQHVLRAMSHGELLTLPAARELGTVGSDHSWRKAFETLLAKGLLERATGNGRTAHLWGVARTRVADLLELANNELQLAGMLWQGAETETETEEWGALESEEPGSMPVSAPEPDSSVSSLTAQLTELRQMLEANLQVTQALFNLVMSMKGAK